MDFRFDFRIELTADDEKKAYKSLSDYFHKLSEDEKPDGEIKLRGRGVFRNLDATNPKERIGRIRLISGGK